MPTSTKAKKKVEKAPATKGKYFNASGKRKCAIARVRLYKGTGEITINDQNINEYITVKTLLGFIKSPLKLTGNDKKYDVIAMVQGGGVNAQASAICHGISKALVEADPLNRPTLKKAGYITRDSRIKERKKYGLKRARKGPQFSKR